MDSYDEIGGRASSQDGWIFVIQHKSVELHPSHTAQKIESSHKVEVGVEA